MANGVGIDFGTTNSIVAICKNDIKKIEKLYNGNTGLPHPSVVWYATGREPIVGYEAKRQFVPFSNRPGNHFEKSIKRRLGKIDHINVLGETKSVEDVAADIFRFLYQDSIQKGYEISEAVVTVPIDYGGKERRALRRAAEKAGIFIKTFIHEPFAAIVGYCYKEGIGLNFQDIIGKNFLVFDWGGGTLDITLAKANQYGIVELATHGINDRSGDYFDELILHHIQNKIAAKLNNSVKEMNYSKGTEGMFLDECEVKKRELSQAKEVQIQVSQAFQLSGKTFDIDEPLTRNDFNRLVEPIVTEAMNAMREVLSTGRINEDSVDLVLMIGGSSRIASVQEAMRSIFGSRLIQISNADSIIAEGAAIVDSLNLKPVFASHISVELSDRSLYRVFKKGEVALAGQLLRPLTFYCTDNRDGKANLVVVENESNDTIPHQKTKLTMTIPVDPHLPKPYNHERVKVDFQLDENMILQIKGKGATQEIGEYEEMHHLSFGLYIGR
jgi:molecular chaperone DnaK (HSP70)